MDSVFTEVSQTLDWSVEMKRTLKTRARNNNALAMLVKEAIQCVPGCPRGALKKGHRRGGDWSVGTWESSVVRSEGYLYKG